MKFALLLLAFLSQSALAIPIVCESFEKTGELPMLRVKIGTLMNIKVDGDIWEKHRIGISPAGDLRKIMYASPTPTDERISMTVIDKNFVMGVISARSPQKNGIYKGTVRISGVLKSKTFEVECLDEAIHGIQ